MCRTGDAIDFAIAQCVISVVDRKDELDGSIDALLCEFAEFDRGDRREV